MAKIINKPVFEEGSQYIERTSQLINDGETGESRYIEESEIEDIVQDVIITELQPIYRHFNNEQSVFVEHMLNKYPNVKVMIGDEEVIPHEIIHNPDMNSLTVYFTEAISGLIVIQ